MTPLAVASSLIRLLTSERDSESDAALLAHYARTRDEAAFAALYRRHGPMVRSVCRRQCRDPHLAADVEQGVWLVLARKAADVSRPDRLAGWLFGVAHRVGRKAAAQVGRNDCQSPDRRAVPDVAVSVMAAELLRVLDEELAGLPEADRLPLVLCYLEGQTQDEAARVCGTCVRTLRRRLDRGRAALRRRLNRRGVTLAAVLAAMAVAPKLTAGGAGVLEAALAAGPVPSSLSPWIAEELTMSSTRWLMRVAMVAGLGLGTAAAAAAVWTTQDRPTPPSERGPAPRAAASAPTDLPKGAIARLGTAAFRHPGDVQALAFVTDGKRLAAIGPSAVSGWTVPDGKVVAAAGEREKGYRHLTVVSPDGRLAVELLNPGAGAADGTIYTTQVTDLVTGKSVGGFPASRGVPQPGPYSLSGAISRDGSKLAVLYCAEVSLYALPDGKLLRRLSDNGKVFRHVAFTPAGNQLIVGSLDRLTLTVWDVGTGARFRVLEDAGGGTGGLSVSPDGKTVVAAVNRQEREKLPDGGTRSFEHPGTEIVAWDLDTGRVVRRIEADAPVRSVHCLPDGKVVGVVNSSESFVRSALRQWRVADGKLLWSAAADHGIRAFAASPDGMHLASAGGGGPVRIWDVQTGKVRPRGDDHIRSIESLAFSADGKAIRSTDDAELRTWDADSGRAAGRFAHPELVGFSRWDAAGRIVAAGPNTIDDPRRVVAVFDAVAGKKLLSVADPERAKGFGWCGFDLSADGARLVLPVTKDKKVRLQLWDVPTATLVWDVETPADWSPGRLTLTADDRVLAGWTDLLTLDARTGKQLARWDLVKAGVLPTDPSNNTHLYPSRDGKMLGYVIQNVGIFLVDSRTGTLVRRIDTPDETHWPLEFSPDGTRFATSTAWTDTGVRVWETETGKLVGRLDESPSRVLEIAFSPDGRRLATGGEDGTALIWTVPDVR
jgi:RNA polymerase sigma factor (sigma-70 family)